MDQKIFHGNLKPADFARSLVAAFNRGSLRVQQVGDVQRTVVQIATGSIPSSGGQTALTVILQSVEDGVAVQVGQQNWMGVAASLGVSALAVFRNPLNLLNRLDDIAQDIENLQMSEDVWRVLENTARAAGASTQLSERLRRLACDYCNSANPPGASNCVACGAPLGDIQPRTCRRCGFVVFKEEKNCPNCGNILINPS